MDVVLYRFPAGHHVEKLAPFVLHPGQTSDHTFSVDFQIRHNQYAKVNRDPDASIKITTYSGDAAPSLGQVAIVDFRDWDVY